MVRWMYRIAVSAMLLPSAPVFSESINPPRAFWYLGGSAAYTQPYFFGLINDIYATAPASLSLGLVAGREAPLTGAHSLGYEFSLARSLPTETERYNFVPTFSQQYPSGSVVRYRNIAQTLALVSMTYSYALSDWFAVLGKLGIGVRHTHATIMLAAADGSVYNAASPSGAMAIFSAALGFEFRSDNFGRLAIFYQSVPSVVYPVLVGTATVRSADMVVVQWRLAIGSP